MVTDVAHLIEECLACKKHKGRVILPQVRFTLAEDEKMKNMPWKDVIIDMSGPYTKAETGEMYILSYTCTFLKVPLLYALPNLQAGHVSRALTTCVFRSRVVPSVVRSDRGQEFMSIINKEFLAILNVRHIKGAALTPRHQAVGERGHHIMMIHELILIHSVCMAFPQEWPALLSAVE